MKQKLQVMEREARTAAVRRECRRVCDLLGIDDPREALEVEVEALQILDDPTIPPQLTPDEIERGRKDMYAAAQARGVDLETVRADIDSLVDALVGAVQAEKG